MIKNLVTTLIYLTIVSNANSQDIGWVKQFGGESYDIGTAICVDNFGNIYTVGSFNAKFEYISESDTIHLNSVGESDVFILKTDMSGKLIWMKTLGGSSYDGVFAITTDLNGNILITGNYWGTTDFDPGKAETSFTSKGKSDVYVLKLDSLGNFLWARTFGGSEYENSLAVTTDNLGNIYTTGYFSGIVNFSHNNSSITLSSNGLDDIFVQKIDPDGTLAWAKPFGGKYSDRGRSISVDKEGNIYTTGYFIGTSDLDPGAQITTFTSMGFSDVFIQKMDASGNFLWAKSFGGSSADFGQTIKLDISGNIFVAGCFYETVDFDLGDDQSIKTSAGRLDIFVQKLDSNGSLIWIKSFGGSEPDYISDINIDALGNIYTTGYFSGKCDFAPEEQVSSVKSNGSFDIFIQKFDKSGNFQWSKTYGGIAGDEANSICIDKKGNSYVTGSFYETVDFYDNNGVTTYTSVGLSDIFIIKLNNEDN